MAYHIQFFEKTGMSPKVVLDVERSELERQVLNPYRNGKDITVKGLILKVSDLDRIKITYSDQPAKALITAIRLEGQNLGIPALDKSSQERSAADQGRDVTDEIMSELTPYSPADKRNVFLVRGRWDSAANAMRTFLRSLDLRVVEWDEAVHATKKASPYTAEILDKGFEMAHAVVVLLTPDDVAALHPVLAAKSTGTEKLTGQARPNVLFEAGMAWQREKDRTLLVEFGNLRKLSDLSGVYAVRFDNSPESRRSIAARLTSIGAEVNDQGQDWLKAGRFPRQLRAVTADDFRLPHYNPNVVKGIPLRWILLARIKELCAKYSPSLDSTAFDPQDIASEVGVKVEVVRSAFRILADEGFLDLDSSVDRMRSRIVCRITPAGLAILDERS